MQNISGKWNAATATPVSCESAQCFKRHFVWKISGKMLDATVATTVLCEPVLSKCAWTFHKSHFAWTFIDTTSIEHRALTLTVRTPQCGHTVCGNIVIRALRAEEGSFST